jgi:hypothetical protein
MTELKGIHNGPMTVKLVCGGIIEGVRFDAGMLRCALPCLDTTWHTSGRFFSYELSPLDIAEIISKPPPRTMKELHDAGELEVGMRFRCGRSGYVWLTSKTTEGRWLFSAYGQLFYTFDGVSRPDQMILQEDNT